MPLGAVLEKDPSTWTLVQWGLAMLAALGAGVARLLADVRDGAPWSLLVLAARGSGSVAGGLTLALLAAGIGLNGHLQLVSASVGGALGMRAFDLAADEIKRRFGRA